MNTRNTSAPRTPDRSEFIAGLSATGADPVIASTTNWTCRAYVTVTGAANSDASDERPVSDCPAKAISAADDNAVRMRR